MPGPLDGLKKAKPQGPSNEVEQELNDIINRYAGWRPLDSLTGEVLVDHIPRPPNARPKTLTPPNIPQFGNNDEPMWDYMMRIVPELQGRSPSIQYGPTEPVLDVLARSGLEAHHYPTTNLLGAMSTKDKRISLNPRLDYPQNRTFYESTVPHEMAHTVGVKHGRDMDMIEQLAIMARDAQRLKR